MTLRLPPGKTVAVCISVDFDAQSLWIASGRVTPSFLSRGEFGANVGVPRVLGLLERFDVSTTWFIPTHTMETYPEQLNTILDAGYEIAAHGCYHEAVKTLTAEDEERILSLVLSKHEKLVGKIPRGYRSPAWDLSDSTLMLLEKHGFEWDSSLMGNDFQPYYPRNILVGTEDGSTFGDAYKILEMPVSWYLDDFPAFEHIPKSNHGLGDPSLVLDRWKAHLDYALATEDPKLLIVTVHPQTIGRAHHIRFLEEFLKYVASFENTWFASISDIYDCWSN